MHEANLDVVCLRLDRPSSASGPCRFNITADVPTYVGYGAADVGSVDLLINLTDEPPRDAAAFPRIAEIVTSDEDSRQRSRRRFADYRDNGHTLDTHKL